jgi:hypothetical protein
MARIGIIVLGSLAGFALVTACGREAATTRAENTAVEAVDSTNSSVHVIPTTNVQQARFFVNGDRNPTLLSAVREGTDDRVSVDGHLSMAYASCGTGCGSYWFVDRNTGGVIEVPSSSLEEEMTWDVEARPDSNLIEVTFGPRDGTSSNCSTQQFRLRGTSFETRGPRRPVSCPT